MLISFPIRKIPVHNVYIRFSIACFPAFETSNLFFLNFALFSHFRVNMLKKVVHYMEQLAPLKLANLSWDNVGILIEAPPRLDLPGRAKIKEEILLTIDLTPSVLDECLQSNRWVSVIVAYHPLIFKPLNRLQLNDPKQSVVLGAIQHGISVYCPHTSLDACLNGSKLIDSREDPAKRNPIRVCDHDSS